MEVVLLGLIVVVLLPVILWALIVGGVMLLFFAPPVAALAWLVTSYDQSATGNLAALATLMIYAALYWSEYQHKAKG